MMAETSIEWTDSTWNPVAGCSVITAGCTNCYAMRMAARLDAMGVPKYKGLTRKSGERWVWTGKVRLDLQSLDAPLKWKRPRTVFVNSMSDLFHEDVPTGFVRRIWDVMAKGSQHTFQILTKRPDRMKRLLHGDGFPVLPNVWLGTSVENSAVLHRLESLRQTPARIRFVSFEPLIGSVAEADLRDIHWAIVGGESGPRARTMEEDWLSQIHAICERDGVAFFFQTMGRQEQKGGRPHLSRTRLG